MQLEKGRQLCAIVYAAFIAARALSDRKATKPRSSAPGLRAHNIVRSKRSFDPSIILRPDVSGLRSIIF